MNNPGLALGKDRVRIRVPQARKSLAQHVAEGGVLGRVGDLIRAPEGRQGFVTASLAPRTLASSSFVITNEVRDPLFLRAAMMRAHAFAPVSPCETTELSPHLQVWVAIQVDSRVPLGTADSVHHARASSMNRWMLFLIACSLLT